MSNLTAIKKTFLLGGDLEINRIGFGAMRITGDGIWGPPKDKQEALKVLKRAVELGINFIDTADSYGPNVSEDLIAEALYPYPKELVVGTKGALERPGPNNWQVNAHPNHLKKALEGSLKRLKLEQIDLYQLHRIDPKVKAEETFSFLKEAQEAGKIKHIGLSEVSVDDIKHAQEFFDVVSVQNMYSVDNRKWEPVLDYCKASNIAFIPWYPLNAGNVAALEKIKTVAERHQVSTHQIALAWLYQHAENILLIPGTSKVAHLEENHKAISVSLTDQDLVELDSIAATK